MRALVLICGIIVCSSALPATTPRKPADEIFESFFPFAASGESEDDSESGATWRINPFKFFFNPISIIPFPAFPDFGSIFRDAIPSSDPDTKLTNSTIETKVIDGRKVTVNNSYYENTKTGSKIHTVFVNYDSSEGSSEQPTTTPETQPEDKENEVVRELLGDSTSDNGEDLKA